jgi:16S rRNA (cytosine1402-N4)-methyltransferase
LVLFFLSLHLNYLRQKNHLKLLKIDKIDGLLADLGVSSHQFDAAARGFTIREE